MNTRTFSALLVFCFLAISCSQNLSPYEKEIRQFRQEYVDSFIEEERSPLEKTDLKDLRFFVADEKYKVTSSYQLLPEEKAFDIKTSSGKYKQYRKYAKLNFDIGDESLQLFVYESMKHRDMEEYKDYLFLPYTDLTNGDQSYGGGRYLDMDKNDFEGGQVGLDFNKSYNPWCAYSDGFNCPVPPAENDLGVFIYAGEMTFAGTYKRLDDNETLH